MLSANLGRLKNKINITFILTGTISKHEESTKLFEIYSENRNLFTNSPKRVKIPESLPVVGCSIWRKISNILTFEVKVTDKLVKSTIKTARSLWHYPTKLKLVHNAMRTPNWDLSLRLSTMDNFLALLKIHLALLNLLIHSKFALMHWTKLVQSKFVQVMGDFYIFISWSKPIIERHLLNQIVNYYTTVTITTIII